MERSGRLVRTMTRWECHACGFELSLLIEQEIVAEAMHQLHSPPCFSGSQLGETQQTASEAGSVFGSGLLESDDVIVPPAIRLGQLDPNFLMQPFGVQCSQGASSVADFRSALRSANDMMETAAWQRGVASQHPYSFPQPPGRPEDEGSGDFNSGQQLANLRDIPQAEERRGRPIEQPTGSRIEQAISVKNELQCAVCCMKWRSVATAECLHLGCCETCFPKTDEACAVCGGTVTKSHPVEFHSVKLLKDLDIPCPLNVPIEGDNLQAYLHMELPGRNKMKRAIHLIQLRNNSEALPAVDSVLDFMVDNPYPVPSAEEMEPLLTDPNVDDTVKSGLCDYLEAINICMICRRNLLSICLMPCKHLALCEECFKRQPKPEKCPECGMQIEYHVAVYWR